MNKRARGFRARLVQLLGVSMLLSASLTYGIFKLLQLYYSGVKWEDPEAEVRRFIYRLGDFNVSLMLFIPLMLIFFSSSPSLISVILTRFQRDSSSG